jgi:hypothetical protein
MNRSILVLLSAVALGTLSTASHAQLVQNGNFAQGGDGFTGWDHSSAGDPYWTAVTNQAASPSGSTTAAGIGSYFNDLLIPAPPITGFVSQSIPTVAGTLYTLTFSYGELNVNQSTGGGGPQDSACCYLDPDKITSSHDPNANPWAQDNSLNVLWDGSSVYSDSDFLTSDVANTSTTNADDGQTIGDYFYKTVSFDVLGDGSSIPLEFDARDYQQNVILTDISLQEVPEPAGLAVFGFAIGAFLLLRRRNGDRLA